MTIEHDGSQADAPGECSDGHAVIIERTDLHVVEWLIALTCRPP
jgi:hypothetical protein